MNIAGLDIGTSGCKLSVYDDKGNFVYNSYKEYDVLRRDGAQTIDANAIYAAVLEVIKDCAEKCDISAIGVTTFGETFVALDENDNVLLPSMLYTDPRGDKEVQNLIDKLGEDRLTYISGVKPHQMYSLPKIMWIKNNEPEIYSKIKRILLMEDFIVYMLTGIAQIDYSLAARTMALDIRKKEWSKEVFDAAGVDMNLMSTPVKTGSIAGKVKEELAKELGLKGTIIVNGCHDQVASALGAGVFSVGTAADGTGTVECVVPMFNKIPENKALYDEGYSIVPYVFDGTYVCYALSFTGGATLKWFRDNFAEFEKKEFGDKVYAILDDKISQKPTDILILPHFSGAANPYMDTSSKAAILGLTLEHTKYDIYKALMEGVTYEMMTNIEHLKSFGIEIDKLVATGGGALSSVWLQIKADILNRPITTITAKEAGTAGTCMLTAVASELFENLKDAGKVFVKENKTCMPKEDNAKIYQKQYNKYKKIYALTKEIVNE